MNHLSRLLLTPFLVLRGLYIAWSSKKTRYIPDDIISKIFNLCDAKSIFNCCLVSRRFRELAFRNEHISLQIRYSVSIRESKVPVWPQGLLEFLKSFPRIRFARIEFFCDAPNPNDTEQMPDSLLRWKHGPQGSITLVAKKCVPSFDDDDMGDCTVIARTDLTEEDVDAAIGSLENSQLDRELWLCYIRRIVEVLPNVQEVTAVDFGMHGRMVVDGGHIDFLRGTSPKEDVKIRGKLWIARHVKVLSSAFVLKDVVLCLVRLNDVSDDLVVQNFCEDGEFFQAMMRIMAEAPSLEKLDVATNYDFL